MQRSHHIFMPYFGVGADDRVALRLVLQLAQNPEVTATVVYYESDTAIQPIVQRETVQTKGSQMESFRPHSHNSGDQSSHGGAFYAAIRRSLPAELARRVVFETASSQNVVKDALARAQLEVAQDPRNGGDIIVVGRHIAEFKEQREGSRPECLGFAAEHIAASGIRASLIVVQAQPQVEGV